jgi:DNA-binding MarR family transcriptional regulator
MKETENPTSDLRPTSTIEDYLIWVYIMERDGEEIVAARLAEALGVSPPTVTITLKRMERDGWLVNDPDKHIRLSPTGHEAAQSVLRRHMLTAAKDLGRVHLLGLGRGDDEGAGRGGAGDVAVGRRRRPRAGAKASARSSRRFWCSYHGPHHHQP